MNILTEFNALSDYHFTEPRTGTLDQLARALGLDSYDPPQAQQYRIYDAAGLPICCHICGGNHWVWAEEWICDHSRDEEYELVPFPVRDERKFGVVSRWEAIE